jgi:hypothetical protein
MEARIVLVWMDHTGQELKVQPDVGMMERIRPDE